MRSVFILSLLIFFAYRTQAQTTFLDSTSKKVFPFYLKLFVGCGELFSNNKHLSQGLSLPYTSTSSAAGLLSLNKSNFVGNNFSVIGGGFEIGFGMFFVDIFAQGLLSNSKKYGSLPNYIGEGVLGVNIAQLDKKRKFTLQASVAFGGTSSDFSLGEINNTNSNISILGQQANSTFYFNGSSQKGQYNYVGNVNATQLNVDYHCDQLYLAPKIGFCKNPLRYKFHWGFYMTYNLPIKSNEYFTLTQDGTTNGHDVTFSNYLPNVSLAQSNATLINNGAKAISTPYLAKGFSFIMTVGYNFINGINFNKKSKK